MAFPGTSDSPATTNGSHPEPGAPAEWPVQATDAIVRVVDSVRDKTTGPALNVARWLIYGLVVALLAIPLSVFALIGVIRLLEGGLLLVSQHWEVEQLHDPVWIVYGFIGAIFVLAGLVCFRKGKAPSPA
jgi:hypothetical protein